MTSASDSTPIHPPLSERVLRKIHSQYPRDQWDDVAKLLHTQCGPTLAFQEDSLAGQERVQLAVLKLSKGDWSELTRYVEIARLDWRDVLWWSGG